MVRHRDPPDWQQIRVFVEEALDLAPVQRDELLARVRADSPTVASEVARLLDLDLAGPTLDPPVGLHEPKPPLPQIGPYALRRRLGVGGMGSVWLAVQTGDIQRRVAIKLLREGTARDEILARFQRERQVLANLEHPGIARLIDGGVTDGGLPYLVMEYVEGTRIDTWCDEQGLAVRARLELFRKVCDAVLHAHQRLVVHRDLKPGNILVTAEGNPKLLDFGIAKVLDAEKQASSAEVTLGVMRFFTPAYASPEQIKGLPVTTVSDVYSLGILLYQLLTGRLPRRIDTTSAGTLARITATAEPERPSVAARAVTRQLARELAGDLDRIVLKALRPEPLRRYATVHDLAEDVRRYLAGLPVTARPDSTAYRVSRFVRRNKAAVGFATLLGASLCVALVVAQMRQHELEVLSTDLEQARALADRRFADIRRFVTSSLFQLHDRIVALPGATEPASLLLETGIEYLDRLAEDSNGNVELERELANAYFDLSNRQANHYGSNLGDVAASEASLAKAREHAEILVRGGEPDARDRALLTHIEVAAGDLGHARLEPQRRLECYRKAVQWCEPFEHDAEASARNRHALAYALSRLAGFLRLRSDLQGAADHYARAGAVLESLVATHADVAQYRGDLATCDLQRGEILGESGQADAALLLIRSSAERAKALSDEHPASYPFARQCVAATFSLAIALETREATDEARRRYGELIEVTTRMLDLDPNNDRARRDFVLCHLFMAGLENRAQRWAEAIAHAARALPVAKARVAPGSADWIPRFELAQLHLETGRARRSLGQELDAGADLGQTAAILESYWEPDRALPDLCRYFAQTAQNLGTVLGTRPKRGEDGGTADAARLWLRRGEAVLQRMVDDGLAIETDHRDLTSVRKALADLGVPATPKQKG